MAFRRDIPIRRADSGDKGDYQRPRISFFAFCKHSIQTKGEQSPRQFQMSGSDPYTGAYSGVRIRQLDLDR
jgi:hypothetical protein